MKTLSVLDNSNGQNPQNYKIRISSQPVFLFQNYDLDFSFLSNPIVCNQLKIYPNTFDAVNNLLSKMKNYEERRSHNIHLAALMQSGKTNTYLLLSFLVVYKAAFNFKLKYPRVALRNLKNRVLILLHDSSNQLLLQTKAAKNNLFKKLLEQLLQDNPNDPVLSDKYFYKIIFENVDIIHRNSREWKKILRRPDNNIKLLISDESHVARDASSVLMQKINEVFKSNLDFFYLGVSATPFDDLKHNTLINKEDVVMLKPGASYVTISDLYKAGRVKQSFSYFIKTGKKSKIINQQFWDLIKEKFYKFPNSYNIFRFKSGKEIIEFLELFLENYEQFFPKNKIKIVLMATSIPHNKILNNPLVETSSINSSIFDSRPDVFTLVFVIHAFRMGSALNKDFIGLFFEKGSKNDDTNLQSFSGRIVGYYDLKKSNVEVYTDVTNLQNYFNLEEAYVKQDVNLLFDVCTKLLSTNRSKTELITEKRLTAIVSSLDLPLDKYGYLLGGLSKIQNSARFGGKNSSMVGSAFDHRFEIKRLFEENLGVVLEKLPETKKNISVRKNDIRSRKKPLQLKGDEYSNLVKKYFDGTKPFPSLSYGDKSETKITSVLNSGHIGIVISQYENILRIYYYHHVGTENKPITKTELKKPFVVISNERGKESLLHTISEGHYDLYN